MKRSTRYIKKALVTFLVVLMSIESFGAVVSDNDGSAFITKAEFDSLKNDFQSQIDQYNTSLDAKIDGAISSYLSGIQVAKKTKYAAADVVIAKKAKYSVIAIIATCVGIVVLLWIAFINVKKHIEKAYTIEGEK